LNSSIFLSCTISGTPCDFIPMNTTVDNVLCDTICVVTDFITVFFIVYSLGTLLIQMFELKLTLSWARLFKRQIIIFYIITLLGDFWSAAWFAPVIFIIVTYTIGAATTAMIFMLSAKYLLQLINGLNMMSLILPIIYSVCVIIDHFVIQDYDVGTLTNIYFLIESRAS